MEKIPSSVPTPYDHPRTNLVWGIVKGMSPLILMSAVLIGILAWISHTQSQFWEAHHRTLTIRSVDEIGDLRVVTFTDSDSILVFRHAPHEWFAPPLLARQVNYGWDLGDETMHFTFVMVNPDGRLTNRGGGGEGLLLGRDQLMRVANLKPSASTADITTRGLFSLH